MIAEANRSADSLEPVDAAKVSEQRERVGIITSHVQESNVTQVMVASLIVDDAIQAREEICADTVAEYERIAREAIEAGRSWPFPAINLVGNWVVDGVHRLKVARRLRLSHIPAIRIQGDRDEALRQCLKANAKHGLRRSNADKARAVQLAVDRWPECSDRQIAKLCAVSHTYVGIVRNPERREERAAKVATLPRQSVRQAVEHKPVSLDPFLDSEPTAIDAAPTRCEPAQTNQSTVTALDLLEHCERQLGALGRSTDRLKGHSDGKQFGRYLDDSVRAFSSLLGTIRQQLTCQPIDDDEAF